MWWGPANESRRWNAAVLEGWHRRDWKASVSGWKKPLEDMDHLFRQQARSPWGDSAFSHLNLMASGRFHDYTNTCYRINTTALVGLLHPCQKVDVQEESIWVSLLLLTNTEATWTAREVASAAGLEVLVHQATPGILEQQPRQHIHSSIYQKIKTGRYVSHFPWAC